MPEICIPAQLKCPITGMVMQNPVTTAAGQTYEKKSIKNWLLKNDVDFVTKEKLLNKLLTPNLKLKEQLASLNLCTELEAQHAIRSKKIKNLKKLNFPDNFFNYVMTDGYDTTLFHYAALYGTPKMMLYMLKHGAELNVTAHGTTPLHDTAYSGKIENLKILLKKKADIEARDWNGYTPLHKAVLALVSNPAIIQILLENGANTRARDTLANETPYELAVSLKKTDIVKLIEKYDVEILSKKVENLEYTYTQLEQAHENLLSEMRQLREQMKVLTKQIKMQNSTNLEENSNSSHAVRRFGTLY